MPLTTPLGFYVFERIPFGLCKAPDTVVSGPMVRLPLDLPWQHCCLFAGLWQTLSPPLTSLPEDTLSYMNKAWKSCPWIESGVLAGLKQKSALPKCVPQEWIEQHWCKLSDFYNSVITMYCNNSPQRIHDKNITSLFGCNLPDSYQTSSSIKQADLNWTHIHQIRFSWRHYAQQQFVVSSGDCFFAKYSQEKSKMINQWMPCIFSPLCKSGQTSWVWFNIWE